METIDVTPTWVDVLPVYMAALESGNETGRRAAKEELLRMAKAADSWNEFVKSQETEGSTERIKVVIPKSDEESQVGEEDFSKYLDFLAVTLRCFPEDIVVIAQIDDNKRIQSLKDHGVEYRQIKDITKEIDRINPNVLNDGHHVIVIPNNVRAVVANGAPIKIFMDKKNIKKVEKQLKPL